MTQLTKIPVKFWIFLTILIAVTGGLFFWLLNFKIELYFHTIVSVSPDDQLQISFTNNDGVRICKGNLLSIKINHQIFRYQVADEPHVSQNSRKYQAHIEPLVNNISYIPLIKGSTLSATVIYDEKNIGNIIWNI